MASKTYRCHNFEFEHRFNWPLLLFCAQTPWQNLLQTFKLSGNHKASTHNGPCAWSSAISLIVTLAYWTYNFVLGFPWEWQSTSEALIHGYNQSPLIIKWREGLVIKQLGAKVGDCSLYRLWKRRFEKRCQVSRSCRGVRWNNNAHINCENNTQKCFLKIKKKKTNGVWGKEINNKSFGIPSATRRDKPKSISLHWYELVTWS